MTAFGMFNIFFALVLGAFVGFIVVTTTVSRQKSSNPGALAALQERMGRLHNVCLFISGAAPLVAVLLISTLRTAPTLLDTIVLIVLVGLGMLASFTLYGNLVKAFDERTPSSPSR